MTARVMKLVVIAALAAAVAACSTEKVRPTEDSKTALEAFKVLDTVTRAYMAKDYAGMRGVSTEDGFVMLIKGLKKVDTAKVETYPVWVTIKPDERVLLRIGWDGAWTYVKDGNSRDAARNGITELVLAGKPLKLVSIGAESPFSSPEDAEPMTPEEIKATILAHQP